MLLPILMLLQVRASSQGGCMLLPMLNDCVCQAAACMQVQPRTPLRFACKHAC